MQHAVSGNHRHLLWELERQKDFAFKEFMTYIIQKRENGREL
jgi:hypothetical protein